jgi:hypothetical protein
LDFDLGKGRRGNPGEKKDHRSTPNIEPPQSILGATRGMDERATANACPQGGRSGRIQPP